MTTLAFVLVALLVSVVAGLIAAIGSLYRLLHRAHAETDALRADYDRLFDQLGEERQLLERCDRCRPRLLTLRRERADAEARP